MILPLWEVCKRGLPRFRSCLSDHVVANTPEVSQSPLSLPNCDADFARTLEARPLQFCSLRGYLRVHSRYNLVICVVFLRIPCVESLSTAPFPAQYRLLATWLESFTMSRTLKGRNSFLIRIEQEQLSLAPNDHRNNEIVAPYKLAQISLQ
jgi:hypothetical protein